MLNMISECQRTLSMLSEFQPMLIELTLGELLPLRYLSGEK